MFDVAKIKNDFPILKRKVNGKGLVYLDNAATSQKPQAVIDALVEYYSQHNANVHRGIHTLGDESTKAFHAARDAVAGFVGVDSKELIWVRNSTEAINLVAYAWARKSLKDGDLIITSELEHHSNIVTWQEVAKDTGAQLSYVDVNENGQVDMKHLEAMLESLGGQVKLVALAHVSNATGAVLPVKQVVKLCKKFTKGAKVLIDAAQSVPHMKVDFAKLDVDFMAFSGHKMYGPMGIGGLVVKQELLETMQPFLVGGGMISEVHLNGTEFGELPDKFDAGTPNVAGAVGLASACEYLEGIGMEEVERHGIELVEYCLESLKGTGRISLIGPIDVAHRLGSVAFVMEGVHAHDVAQVLDSEGIAVRRHHCTMPLHEKFEWVATTRASFGIYNSKQDIDRLVKALEKVKEMFKLG